METVSTIQILRNTTGNPISRKILDKTIKGIKNAVDEGFFVNVATTAIKNNYHEIPKIIDLCEKMNVTWFILYNFIPTGRGEFIIDNDLTSYEREKLLNDI